MTKGWLRTISVLEIAGGCTGVLFVVLWLVEVPIGSIDLLIAMKSVMALGFHVLAIAAGVALWRETRFGRSSSTIVQALCIPKLFGYWFSFAFGLVGLDVYVLLYYFSGTGASFYIFAPAVLHLNPLMINIPYDGVGVGVGVLSCILLAKLLRYEPAGTTASPLV